MRSASLLVVAAALLAPGRAAADWNLRIGQETDCQESSIVVGRCGQFAAGWRPPMMRFEIGPVLHRTTIGPMVGEDEEANVTGRILRGGDVTGRGIGGRFTVGYLGYYLATDVAVSGIDEAPAVSPVARSERGDASAASTTGMMFAMRMGIGKEVRLGRLMFGSELGVGIGVVTIGDLPAQYVADPRFILDARVHAGVWLTPHISVLGHASTSLFRDGERTFGIALGFSVFPSDGLR